LISKAWNTHVGQAWRDIIFLLLPKKNRVEICRQPLFTKKVANEERMES
jgi:hypothetical protein